MIFVAQEAIHQKREEQRQLQRSLCALASGARPAHEAGWAGARLACRRRPAAPAAYTGLLKVGADVLQIVAGFLAWEMRLRRSWIAHTFAVNDCHFSPDGQSIVTCSFHMAKLWRVDNGNMKGELIGHTSEVFTCCFAPDGRTVLSSSCDMTLKLWDAESGDLLKTKTLDHEDMVTCCAFSPDGITILCGAIDGCLSLWRAATGELQESVWVGGSVLSCCFSPDGTRFLVGGEKDGVASPLGKQYSSLRLFNTVTRQSECAFAGHDDYVPTCSFSPCGKTILSASADQTMKMWSTATGKLLWDYIGHGWAITRCVFAPGGQTILSASDDGALMLWTAATGKLRRIVDETTDSITCCRFSSDGKSIIAGYANGRACDINCAPFRMQSGSTEGSVKLFSV